MAIQLKDPLQRASTLYLVDLDTGAVRRRPIHGGSNSMKLLANSATQAWFGYASYLTDEETKFDGIVMLDMSRKCEGTPTCSGLATNACAAAPGCTPRASCTGTPTDPCTYTTAGDCFARVCSWDPLNDVCSPRESCEAAPDEVCINTAGCTYSAAIPASAPAAISVPTSAMRNQVARCPSDSRRPRALGRRTTPDPTGRRRPPPTPKAATDAVTKGEPYAPKIEGAILSFCDERGGRKIDLVSGTGGPLARTCTKDRQHRMRSTRPGRRGQYAQ